MVAHECGLSDQVTPILVNFRDERSGYISINPLGKVPALTLDDGMVLVDSPVICEYLDSRHPREKLFPQSGSLAGARYNYKQSQTESRTLVYFALSSSSVPKISALFNSISSKHASRHGVLTGSKRMPIG